MLANYFVIVVAMLLGSESFSPSNTHPSVRGPNSLEVTIEDKI